MTPETILISLAIGLGGLLLFLIGFVVLRTILYSPPQKKIQPREFVAIDGQSVAERLGVAVQYKTVSNQDPAKLEGNYFLALHRLLRTLYPLVHEKLTLEKINDYSLLYTWQGKNPDLKPIMLIAHLDVVPADESEESGWTYPPFSGEIAEGYVWGRGTLDDKNCVIGILEALEYLLKHDFEPERTVYIGFGHDEEVFGAYGAPAIAKVLESRGVKLASLLDEGGTIIEGFMPNVDTPVGVIGISEKGYLSLKLTVSVEGGHSSMPPQETAIGILSRAITSLEINPMPAHLEVIEYLMSYLGSALPFFQRILFANTWLFSGLLKKQLSKSQLSNASIRTTTAPTMVHAGVKDNVLPGKAEAVVNFRVLPGDDLRAVYEMVLERIDDPRVKVTPLLGDTLEGASGWNPSPVADTESPYFLRLSQLIKEANPNALVTPYLVPGGTDAHRYAAVTENAFRFLPILTTREDLAGMHGVDERLSIENCGRMVSFYIAYIEEISSLPGDVDQVPEAETLPETPAESGQVDDEEPLPDAIEEGDVFTEEELEAFKAQLAKQKLEEDLADDVGSEEAEASEDSAADL